MVRHIRGLLGKFGRPMIVCGQLVIHNHSIVLASLDNYHVYFRTQDGEILEVEGVESLLTNIIVEFERKYAQMRLGFKQEHVDLENSAIANVEASADMFTGAIVIRSALYREMSKLELHSHDVQLSAKQAELVREFAVEFIENYYHIYCTMFHRRIVAQHMPMQVKAHFVKGLFQPLIVETDLIRSPFKYGENEWIYALFKPCEVYLERKEHSVRKLNLSCLAMCDVARIYNTDVVTEMDKRQFLLLLCMSCLHVLDIERSVALTARYKRVYNSILATESGKNLMSQMINYAESSHRQLKVV